MAYREVHGVEIREIIRRWQEGLSQHRIARGMGLSRQTVRRYTDAAEAAGLTPDGPEPSEEQLAALATLSLSGPRQVEAPSEELLSPWAEQIERWLETDRLQLTRIQELLAGRGCEVSYTTLRRFIRRRGWRHRQPSTVRMDDGPPGEVAEMDFGRLGFIRDPESGRRRTVWALVVVWRYSRHCFVWPTTSQKLDAVIEGLEEAWAFFGGVPRYLVVDNFPAAVAGADALHPRLTRGFLEYARHRGFITDPARVRHPRDKPRVERSIPYVRERLFKGGDFRDVVDLRSAARSWCLEVAGQRIHGTTRRRPLEVFRKEELPLLAPWDGEPYEVPDWRTATVHPDHHIACQYALYSVPSTACPPRQKVEVQLGSKLVRIYHRGQLIKVHPRQRRGGRATDPNDYPAELTPYTRRAPDWIQPVGSAGIAPDSGNSIAWLGVNGWVVTRADSMRSSRYARCSRLCARRAWRRMSPARDRLNEYGSISRFPPWYPRSTSKRFTAANRTGSMRFPNPVVQKVGGGVHRSSSSASGTGSGDSSPLSQAKIRGNSDQKWSKSGRALN